MNRQYILVNRFFMLVIAFLIIASQAQAGDISWYLQSIEKHRAYVEAQMGIAPDFDIYPEPTSYYDDKEAHYEQVLIMSDFIDKGIR